MDLDKVSAILEWETPRTTKDVQGFLGFANFYRRFIYSFFKIAAPMTDLTKMEGGVYVKFKWTEEC